MTRPTPAQLTALRLAAIEPIRYFKGGWYSIPSLAGENQTLHEFTMRRDIPSTNAGTLRACCGKGWIQAPTREECADIYSCRWVITDAGRSATTERACITCTTAPANCIGRTPAADVWHRESEWPAEHVKSGLRRDVQS